MGDLSLRTLMSAGVRSASGLVLWGSECVGKESGLSIPDDLLTQIVRASCSSSSLHLIFYLLLKKADYFIWQVCCRVCQRGKLVKGMKYEVGVSKERQSMFPKHHSPLHSIAL